MYKIINTNPLTINDNDIEDMGNINKDILANTAARQEHNKIAHNFL